MIARLDTKSGVETPEGVALELAPAGLVARFSAFAIDFGIRGAVYFVVLQIAAVTGNVGIGAALVIMFLLEWFYPVAFELLMDGATPGKRVAGIAVVEDNGLPVSVGASVVRNLLRVADFLPLFYGFGVLSMLIHPQFKRLGDLAAGTQVVYRSKAAKLRPIPEADALPPPAPLSVESQHAVIAFAERSAAMTAERRAELAEITSARLGKAGEPIERRLFGMAQWLMGRR